MHYETFELRIQPGQQDTYEALVTRSLAGDALASFTLPWADDVQAATLWQTVGASRHLGAAGQAGEPPANLQALGTQLYQALFSGEVADCLRRSLDEARRRKVGLRIRLRIDDRLPVLANLPWEYLYAPALGRFLALSDHTPLLRYLEVPHAAAMQPASPPTAADPTEAGVPYVLIVDQFEEIITVHAERWQERAGFFRGLNEAMQADPNLSVVLSLREDFVPAIEPYAPLLAERMRARFYMQRMQERQALEAVRNPVQARGKTFDPQAAQALVDNLRQIQTGRETAALGQFVEPVQLQVVCFQLWESLGQSEKPAITLADLERLAGGRSLAEFVNQALRGFYERVLGEVLADPALKSLGEVSEASLRRWFSQHLITELGTRSFVYQGEHQTAGMPNPVLGLLRDRYLLRAEDRAGGLWYELVHDRFVEPIRESNRAWLATASDDNTARLWRWRVDDLIHLACMATGRNFTAEEWQRYFPGEAYRRTCAQWPGHPSVPKSLRDEANTLARQGDFAGAVARFEEALALDPLLRTSPPGYVGLFCALQLAAAVESEAAICQQIDVQVSAVTAGESVTGTVRSRAIDFWRFDVATPITVTIDLMSDNSSLDAYLTLYASDGSIIDENDDFSGSDSRIEASLPAGRYLIGAAGYERSSGAYRLTVSVSNTDE